VEAVHYDPAAARSAGYADVVAPPNLLAAIVEWALVEQSVNRYARSVDELHAVATDFHAADSPLPVLVPMFPNPRVQRLLRRG
jgi:hypothetical protein